MNNVLESVYLDYQNGISLQNVIDGLAQLGHELKPNLGNSIVQAISRHDGFLYAASDFRKGGQPDGY